ncbi:MAG: substrate-binding periplasmic protein [Oligoflexales bacterium]
MAADKTLEPWIYENVKTGEFTGFEYEYAVNLVRLIDPKLKVEVVNGEWAKLPQDVRAGKADFVLNAWFRPPEREIPATDSWTQCYYNTGFSIMYDSKEKETPTMKSLQKKDTVIGIYPDPAPIKILAKYDILKYKKSKEHEQYKNFIVNDVVDYFFFDAPAAQYQAKISKGMIKATSSLPGTEDCYGIMVRKEAPQLLNEFNKAIVALEKQKKMLNIARKYGIE